MVHLYLPWLIFLEIKLLVEKGLIFGKMHLSLGLTLVF